VVENRNVNSEERIIQLEKELKETIKLGEESDRKFEEARLTVSVFTLAFVKQWKHTCQVMDL